MTHQIPSALRAFAAHHGAHLSEILFLPVNLDRPTEICVSWNMCKHFEEERTCEGCSHAIENRVKNVWYAKWKTGTLGIAMYEFRNWSGSDVTKYVLNEIKRAAHIIWAQNPVEKVITVTEKEENEMDKREALLINANDNGNVKYLVAKFGDGPTDREYTYKVPKEVAVVVGDIILVSTYGQAGKKDACKLIEVIDIKFELPEALLETQIKYPIDIKSKGFTTIFALYCEKETTLLSAVRAARRMKTAREAVEEVKEFMSDTERKLLNFN